MAEKTQTSSTDIATTAQPERGRPLATREEAKYISPPVDIYETEDALMVLADMPGIQKDDLDIRVEDDILTIRGNTTYEQPSNLLRGEFNLMSFYRQFRLNEEVDQSKISAEIKHGVLTIMLPKAEKAKPKQISVKVG